MALLGPVVRFLTKAGAKIGWKGGFMGLLGGIFGGAVGSANANSGDGGGGWLPQWVFDPLGLGNIGKVVTLAVVALAVYYAYVNFIAPAKRKRSK